MTRDARLTWLLAALVAWVPVSVAGSADNSIRGADKTPGEFLDSFAKAWKPQRGYMRPLDDAGWKARMEVFQELVRLGEKAVPALTDALAKGEPETRIFAAQALAFLANPATRPALEKALKDPHPAVRLYAIDALSMFGRLEPTDDYRRMRDQDTNRDVRSHMAFALQRDDKPQPAAIRKTLIDYDLALMGTARVGKPAPDFTLTDALGKTCQLSQFRGKKPVVLVFIYGDT